MDFPIISKATFAQSTKSRRWTGVLVTVTTLLSTFSSFAKNLDPQIKLLSAVFLEQQFTAICGIKNPSFLAETSGPLGTMAAYSQYIKEEVIIGLTSEEISSVLGQAANSARSGARTKLQEFSAGPGMIDEQRLRIWCETVAKPDAIKIISMFEHKHDLSHCKILGISDLSDCAP